MTDLTTMTDADLQARITRHENAILNAKIALGPLNTEWNRRHKTGECSDDCREPMAGITF